MARYNGPIEDLEPGQQVNMTFFRLAEALGYEVLGGTITAELDEILDEAVELIQWRKNRGR